MSKKMLSRKRTITTQTQLLGFTYPKLHMGKNWYVDFYAFDPGTGDMRRKKFMLDKISSKTAKKKKAIEIIEKILQELRNGWNPWVKVENNRGFVPIDVCFDKYMEYVKKKSRAKTISAYKSRVTMMKLYISSCVVPIKFAYQYDEIFINDYLDWVYLDRECSERTRNNYRAWCYGFADFLIKRNYIYDNPVEHVPILEEKRKMRQDLTPEMLATLRQHLYATDKHFLLACMMEYYTFIRPTELSYIRVGDISVKEKSVFVSGKFSKNKRDGKVGLHDSVIKLMLELGTLTKPSSYFLFSKHFIPGPDRHNADTYNRRWKSMREELKWPDCYQFYSLKDSGIRDLANAEGIVIARDQARHRDVTTTNRYIQAKDMQIHKETTNYHGNL